MKIAIWLLGRDGLAFVYGLTVSLLYLKYGLSDSGRPKNLNKDNMHSIECVCKSQKALRRRLRVEGRKNSWIPIGCRKMFGWQVSNEKPAPETLPVGFAVFLNDYVFSNYWKAKASIMVQRFTVHSSRLNG